MNKIQSIGIILIIIGLVLLIVLPIFIVFGKIFITISFFGGWTISIIGAGIIIASLIRERMNDIKKEKFDKNY